MNEELNEKNLKITELKENDAANKAQIQKLKQLMRAMKYQYDAMKAQVGSGAKEIPESAQISNTLSSPNITRQRPTEM